MQLGGPSIPVLTGRKDSMQAYKALADANIPLATTSVDQLLQNFSSKGLTLDEAVALLGIKLHRLIEEHHQRDQCFIIKQKD